MSMKEFQEKMTGKNCFTVIMYMLLCSLAVNAHAEGCGTMVIYNGKGAGQVVFEGKLHAAKKNLACADCHDATGFSSALFEMKRGANAISMRNMELGRYCGYCHDGKQAFSTTDSLNCSKCHQK
jgi:c(7)-type cytochrome triheme protein